MNNNFASLCLLSYKRPQKLQECINTLMATIDYPCEIIINFDGIESFSEIIPDMFIKSSKVIVSRGPNRGIGRSFEDCLQITEGKYIFKIDTDLVFRPHWLSTAIKILNNNIDIGAVSLFDYLHYKPDDIRFRHKMDRNDCIIVADFVSSIYGFRARDKAKIIPTADDGNHKKLGGLLAITKEDFVTTKFGYNDSVYVYLDEKGEGQVMGKHDYPLIFSEIK